MMTEAVIVTSVSSIGLDTNPWFPSNIMISWLPLDHNISVPGRIDDSMTTIKSVVTWSITSPWENWIKFSVNTSKGKVSFLHENSVNKDIAVKIT